MQSLDQCWSSSTFLKNPASDEPTLAQCWPTFHKSLPMLARRWPIEARWRTTLWINIILSTEQCWHPTWALWLTLSQCCPMMSLLPAQCRAVFCFFNITLLSSVPGYLRYHYISLPAISKLVRLSAN